MCLILIALNSHPTYPLIVAANRDEWRARPTAALDYWQTDPVILAGRDLKAGGSWLGIARNGRLAAVTNLRHGLQSATKPRSRGQLVTDFLTSNETAEEYIATLEKNVDDYNPFNFLLADQNQIWCYCSVNSALTPVHEGIHCISNGLPTEQWPKTERSKQLLSRALHREPLEASALFAALFAILHDQEQPGDESLPDTRISRQQERQLAPIFIEGNLYGTRCSSLLLIDQQQNWQFLERSFDHPTPDRTFSGRFSIRCSGTHS